MKLKWIKQDNKVALSQSGTITHWIVKLTMMMPGLRQSVSYYIEDDCGATWGDYKTLKDAKHALLLHVHYPMHHYCNENP